MHLGVKALLPAVLLDPLFVGTAVAAGTLYPLVLLFIRSMALIPMRRRTLGEASQ